MNSQAPSRRRYRMSRRARTAEETGQRILEAAFAAFGEQLYDQVSLTDIARGADVTVQTVIRRFGPKEQLFAEMVRWRSTTTRGARDHTPAGDVDGALDRLLDDYERAGAERLHLLAQERRAPAIAVVVAADRRYHHEWVRRAFAPQLAQLPADDRERAYAQLVAVTDLYTWKVLRHDLGLDREATAAAVHGLAGRVLT